MDAHDKPNVPVGSLDGHECDQFWDEVSESLNRLRADPDAWSEYLQEIELLEGGSMDGLHDDPYFTPEEAEEIRAEAVRSRND